MLNHHQTKEQNWKAQHGSNTEEVGPVIHSLHKMALSSASGTAQPTPQAHHPASSLHHYFHYLKQPSPLAQNPYAHHTSTHHMGMGPSPLGGLGPFGLTHHGLEAVGFPQGMIFLLLF